MARMNGTNILAFASLAIVLGAPSIGAPGDADADRAFGRVGPERPVVEIPSDELGGVDAEAVPLEPMTGWEVRSGDHVVELVRPKKVVEPTQELSPEMAQLAAAVDRDEPQTINDLITLLDEQIAARSAADSTTLASATNPSTTNEFLLGTTTPIGEEPTPITVPADQSLASRTTGEASPLGAPASEQAPLQDAEASTGFGWLAQTGLALAVVLALILILAWIFERATRGSRGLGAAISSSKSPAGLIEVLGKYQVSARQSMVLMKFDRRVLLLSQSTPRSGPVTTNTLCELTDPEDVASVLVKVRDAQGESMNHVFKEAMSKADLHTARALNEPVPARPGAASPAPAIKPAAEVAPKPAQTPAAESFSSDFDPEQLRKTIGGEEDERAQLWEGLGSTPPANDPVSSVRRRLQAMRGSVPG